MKLLLFTLLVSISICSLAKTNDWEISQECHTVFTKEQLFQAFNYKNKEQTHYLEIVEKCVSESELLQEFLDNLTSTLLLNMPKDKPLKDKFADLTVKLLYLNAKVGFAPSQHNFAAIHNVDPNSKVFLVPQNYKTFMLWTRKAAAQGEPRALFNLAMRYAIGDERVNLSKDPVMAYKLLAVIAQMNDKLQGKLGPIMSHVNKYKAKIKSEIGAEKARKISKEVDDFDLSSLNS